MPRSHLVVYRTLLIVWLTAITYLAVTGDRNPLTSLLSELNDKVAHATAFYLLALFFDFSFPNNGLNGTKIAFLLAYGALLELAQLAGHARDPSFYDFLADTAGIVLYAASTPLTRRLPLLARRWQADSDG